MKKVGIIAKLSNPKAVEVSGDVAKWLTKRKVEVYGDKGLAESVKQVKVVSKEDMPDVIDTLIVLGGDGTMLSAARVIDGRKIPILGVNLGGLGFLTSITVDEVHRVLGKMLKEERVPTEERMMLSVEVTRGGQKVASYRVLNDAVIKGTIARLVELEIRINKEYVTTYRADGLIVATPTGSTAYSLSAAGPILYPTIHSIIVAPICPFNLTNRPVIIPDWMDVEVGLMQEHARVELTLDGQIDIPLFGGDRVDIKRADTNVYLVKCEPRSYFEILRERLMWEVKKS
jgi:NAD+ kinase